MVMNEMNPLAKSSDKRSVKKEKIRRCKTCEIGKFFKASMIITADILANPKMKFPKRYSAPGHSLRRTLVRSSVDTRNDVTLFQYSFPPLTSLLNVEECCLLGREIERTYQDMVWVTHHSTGDTYNDLLPRVQAHLTHATRFTCCKSACDDAWHGRQTKRIAQSLTRLWRE